MRSKKIVLGVAAIILVMMVSIAAIATNPTDLRIDPTATPNPEDVEKLQSSVETLRETFEVMARSYGIDPTGMTDEQLEAALLEVLPEQDRIKAQLASQSKGNEDLKKDWDQLTPEQRHTILENNARAWGIDPTGMTDEQIEQAIAEKDLELKNSGK